MLLAGGAIVFVLLVMATRRRPRSAVGPTGEPPTRVGTQSDTPRVTGRARRLPPPDTGVRRSLQLALWPLRDPVALLAVAAVTTALLIALFSVSAHSTTHDLLGASAAPTIGSTAYGVAFRRRLKGRRWSVEPPPGSRPAVMLAQLAKSAAADGNHT